MFALTQDTSTKLDTLLDLYDVSRLTLNVFLFVGKKN